MKAVERKGKNFATAFCEGFSVIYEPSIKSSTMKSCWSSQLFSLLCPLTREIHSEDKLSNISSDVKKTFHEAKSICALRLTAATTYKCQHSQPLFSQHLVSISSIWILWQLVNWRWCDVTDPREDEKESSSRNKLTSSCNVKLTICFSINPK